MAPSLLGLGVVLYLLTIEVLRWLRGSDTVWDVLVWAVVLIPPDSRLPHCRPWAMRHAGG